MGLCHAKERGLVIGSARTRRHSRQVTRCALSPQQCMNEPVRGDHEKWYCECGGTALPWSSLA